MDVQRTQRIANFMCQSGQQPGQQSLLLRSGQLRDVLTEGFGKHRFHTFSLASIYDVRAVKSNLTRLAATPILISIVDLPTRRVTVTLETIAGPSDLVFPSNPRRAWVSCSRSNAVLVIDLQTRSVVNDAIDGERPRAMAASPDGSKATPWQATLARE